MMGTHEFMSEHIYLNNGYCYFRFNRVQAVLFRVSKERTVASLLPKMSNRPEFAIRSDIHLRNRNKIKFKVYNRTHEKKQLKGRCGCLVLILKIHDRVF